MKIRLVSLFALLAITACQQCPPRNITVADLEPAPANYAAIKSTGHLKGQITVGEFSAKNPESLPFSVNLIKAAVADSLKKAGFSSHTHTGARYILSARIYSIYKLPICSLSTCTSQARIEYTLADKSGQVIYQQMIISPHNYHGVLLNTPHLSKEGAIRNSIYELFLDLNRLQGRPARVHTHHKKH